MKKEILDSNKYKDELIRGKYANNFSGLDLTHYDWATTEYWRQMLLYINDEHATAPWHAACWERYEITPEYAKQNKRSMARCEGGPNLLEDVSTKGRKKLLNEGPRVKMGIVATPDREVIPYGHRRGREEEDTPGAYVPQLEERNKQVEDMPPGNREAWPTNGGWGQPQRRALATINICHINFSVLLQIIVQIFNGIVTVIFFKNIRHKKLGGFMFYMKIGSRAICSSINFL